MAYPDVNLEISRDRTFSRMFFLRWWLECCGLSYSGGYVKQENMVTGRCGGSRHHKDFDPVKARRVLDQSRRMICMQPPRGPNWRGGLWQSMAVYGLSTMAPVQATNPLGFSTFSSGPWDFCFQSIALQGDDGASEWSSHRGAISGAVPLGDFGGVANFGPSQGPRGFLEILGPRIHWGLWDHVHRNPHVIPTAAVRTSKPRWASWKMWPGAQLEMGWWWEFFFQTACGNFWFVDVCCMLICDWNKLDCTTRDLRMMCEIPSNDHRIVQLMLVRYLGTSTVPVTHKDNSQLQADSKRLSLLQW